MGKGAATGRPVAQELPGAGGNTPELAVRFRPWSRRQNACESVDMNQSEEPMVGQRDEGEGLVIRVLTQEVPGPREGTTCWLARSVTTRHVADGSTEDVALERLLTGIRIVLDAAVADGQSAQEWLRACAVAEPHFVLEFNRQESAGRYEDLPPADWPGGCRVTPRKALYSLS